MSHRFCVKSILENLEVLNLFAILRALNFADLVKSKFRAFQCVKMADFKTLDLPILISRKIWVIDKLCNFHTVVCELVLYSNTTWLRQVWNKKTVRKPARSLNSLKNLGAKSLIRTFDRVERTFSVNHHCKRLPYI